MLDIIALAALACQGVDDEKQCQPWMQKCLASEFAQGHDTDWAFEVCAEAFSPLFSDFNHQLLRPFDALAFPTHPHTR